jgi:hypothetical protein
MQKKEISALALGEQFLIAYHKLANASMNDAFTNFPQNAMSQYYGGTTTTTLMNLIGSLVGYLITYFIIAPRIGRIKSAKRVGIVIGFVSLVFCALICVIPPTMITLWCVCFVLVLITTQLWGGLLLRNSAYRNWFPRRTGYRYGHVTSPFPSVTGICLNLFMIQHGMSLGKHVAGSG